MASESLEQELERLHESGIVTSQTSSQDNRLHIIEIGQYEMDTWYLFIAIIFGMLFALNEWLLT